MRYSLIICILWSLALPTCAQRWEYFTNFHDPKDIITHGGLVYVSSERGIISVDPGTGAQKWYHHYNSNLPEGRPLLGLDESGGLWSSFLDGLFKFEDGEWLRADSLSTDPALAPRFHFLFTNGELWHTATQGVVRRSGGDVFAYFGAESPVPAASYFVNGIEAGHDGAVWVATNRGLLRFASDSWSLWNSDNSNIAGTSIAEIDTDSSGVWLRSGAAIQHFNGDSVDRSFTSANSPIVVSSVYGMDVAPDGRLFVSMVSTVISGATIPCTYCKGGLIEYSNGVFVRYDDSNSGLRIPHLSAVHCSADDHVYTTTLDGTLFEMHNGAWTERFLGNSPISSTHARRVMKGRNDGAMWLVKEYDPWYSAYRIWHYDKECNWTDVYRAPTIVSAAEAVDGSVFVRHYNRIVRVATGQPVDTVLIGFPQQASYGVEYTEIAVDGHGGLWFDAAGYVTYDQMNNATVHEGLAHFVNGVTTVHHGQNSPLQGQFIRSIQVDEQNHVWVLTSSGVFRYGNNEWASWLNWTPALANRVATGLDVRSSSDVWVKYYNGVAHIRDGAIQNFDLTGLGDFGGANALEDSLMYLFHNYPAYVSTYDHLAVYVIADTSGYWLSPANTQSLVAHDGSIWFGNHKGLYHYWPADVGDACSDPPWSAEWLIYPNPVNANSLFVVGVEPNIPARVRVFAMDGKMIQSLETTPTSTHFLSFQVRTDALAHGAYIITLHQGDRMVSSRFVKE